MIHVVGNAALDTIFRLDRFPEPGETIVALGSFEDLGGKGANQATMIARCGQRVRLVAAVGADAVGERIRQSLAAERVEIDGVRTWPGASDRCVICVDRNGENTIVSLVEAARSFDPIATGSLEDRIAPGDFVVLQGNLRAGVTRACLALAKSQRAATVLNPSPSYPAEDYDWRLVDLVVLNRGEAIALGRRQDPVEGARAVIAAGAEALVLTLGAEGAVFFSSQQTIRTDAERVEMVDATGAGDVFLGALVAARAGGRSWRAALHFAVRAAALCVQRAGVLASFPTREEMSAIFGEKAAAKAGP